MNVPQWQNNPPQFPSQQGRDPRTPFGSPAPGSFDAPTQIEAYRQPRGGAARSILVGAVALAVVAAVLLWLQFGSNQGGATGGPSSAPPPSANTSSLGAQESRAPFEANGGGVFELLAYNWNGDNDVEVQVRVTLSEGSASFDIYLVSSKNMRSYPPLNSPSLRAKAGQPLDVTLKFAAPRDKSTIVLSTDSGRGRGLAAVTLNP